MLLWTVPGKAESAAIAVVRGVHEAAAIAANSLAAEQGEPRSRIRSSFDFAALAQRALGPAWHSADASDRAVLVDVIAESVVTGVVQRLGKRSAGPFEILDEAILQSGDRLVRTSVTLGPERIALVDWRLAESQANPKIVDIIVEGRSMAITEREKFRRELDASGGSLKALAARLSARMPPR